MDRVPVVIESAGHKGAAQGDHDPRPWHRDFSIRSPKKRPRQRGRLRFLNPVLAKLTSHILLHRRSTFEDLAQVETDPRTEYHHHLYCRNWCAGRDHMDYLMRRGLEPGHRVLDFGCGTMRTGVWLARYLAAGNYFGIDAHRPSLETAARYEIPLHGLEEKCPRLLHDAEGRVDHFGTTFDYVLLLAVLIHLQTDVQHQVLNRIARVLAPGGRIVIWRVPPTLTEASLRGANELLVTHRELTRSRFGDFTLDWMELQRAAR